LRSAQTCTFQVADDRWEVLAGPDAIRSIARTWVTEVLREDVGAVLEGNYFIKGIPYLDGAVIDISPDAAARLEVLRAGKANWHTSEKATPASAQHCHAPVQTDRPVEGLRRQPGASRLRKN
jgi:hypothetical protein